MHLVGAEPLFGQHELGEVSRGDQVHDEHEELLVLEGVEQVHLRGEVCVVSSKFNLGTSRATQLYWGFVYANSMNWNLWFWKA